MTDETSYHLVVKDQARKESQTVMISGRIGEIKNRLPTLFQELTDPQTQTVKVVIVRATRQGLRCVQCIKKDQPCPHLGQFDVVGKIRAVSIRPDNYLRAR